MRTLNTFIATLIFCFSSYIASEELLRGPNGKPDLNGVWQVLNTANYDLEAHPARAAMQLVEGPVVPVPHPDILSLGAVGSVPAGLSAVVGGKIPYTKKALKQRNENKNNWLERDPEIKCYLPGVPRATYMRLPFQIFHSEKAIFFAYEYAGAVRNIYLEDPGPAPVDSWMGQSWGYWEGDTFVIKASGFNGQTWLDRAGNFHSEELKVTERYTLMNPYTMNYEATIEDEKVFTRPWKISMILYKRVGKDAQLQQFKCVEFVEELLYGQWRGN
jgi:hypothetical protein